MLLPTIQEWWLIKQGGILQPHIIDIRHMQWDYNYLLYRLYHSHTPTSKWPICVVLRKTSVVPKSISECEDLFWFGSSAKWGMVTKCQLHVICLSFLSHTRTSLHFYHNFLLVKERDMSSWVRTTPRLVLEASHSRTNHLVKYDNTRNSVKNMEFLKELKSCFIVSS